MTLIYVLSLLALLLSGFNWGIKLATAILLIFAYALIYKAPRPTGNYTHLHYKNSQWVLTNAQQEELIFTKHRILLEIGLFFLLQLSAEKKNKVLVVFFDQLSTAQYKHLKILEKIN